MKKVFTRKRALVVGVVAALAIAGAAFAYWTTSGSGSGSASVGSQDGAVTLSGSSVSFATLDSSGSITVTAHNTSSSPTHIGHVSVSSITGPAGCDSTTGWFTDNGPVAENVDIPAGGTAVLPNAVSVTLNNAAADQDACQGASLTVNLSSTSS